MLINELSRVTFTGPDAESSPSKHVSLLVKAAVRNAFASVSFLESGEVVILVRDFCNEDNVIW